MRTGRWFTTRVLSLAVAATAAVAGHARAGATLPNQARADSLYRHAQARLTEDTIESRQFAIRDLEAAAVLAPERTEVWHELARLCQRIGDHRRARTHLERIALLRPDDGEAQTDLGLAWKWEWLTTVEDAAYTNAVKVLLRASDLAPANLEARLGLAALAFARGNHELASMAAQSAIACDRHAAEAQLAYATAIYRQGDLPRAAAAFRTAVSRLPEAARMRFADIGALTDSTPTALDRPVVTDAAFWRDQDPDLTTDENEAELDFMARTANALLLFRAPGGVRWDMRAELFVRYGPPAAMLPPPPDRELVYVFPRRAAVRYAAGSMPYPYNMQTWAYPALGMVVELWDRTLNYSFEIPYAEQPWDVATPNPALIEGRPDLVVLGGGRGVFRALPPGVSPLAVSGQLEQFPEASGTRLVAHLQAPASTADSLWGRWIVHDADGREVARGGGALSVSACEPDARHAAQFMISLPPGDYRVDLAVSDARRRGVVHLSERIAPRADSLAMSDLVLLCGEPSPDRPVIIEPNLPRRVYGARDVSVYFELDGLVVDAGGMANFEYTYAIRPVRGRDRTRASTEPVVQASRQETHSGVHRRQFVRAPIDSLARGRYQLEVTVLDQRSGASASRMVEFEKN